jgi:integrase/recombinase XerD
MKHLERLRKMVTWTAKNEWIARDPFSDFKLSFKKTKKEHLTAAELNAVIATELPSAPLQKVRDLFLFSCYTGLAFTDLMEVKPHHTVEGSNNTKRINTVRAKTDIRVNVLGHTKITTTMIYARVNQRKIEWICRHCRRR